MGYYSQVKILTELKNVKLIDICMNLEPTSVKEGKVRTFIRETEEFVMTDVVLFDWEWQKWYKEYEEIAELYEEIYRIIELEKDEEEHSFGHIRMGEDETDLEYLVSPNDWGLWVERSIGEPNMEELK